MSNQNIDLCVFPTLIVHVKGGFRCWGGGVFVLWRALHAHIMHMKCAGRILVNTLEY